MDYNFEYEKKKVFNMKKFLKFYSVVFGILALTTYAVYTISLQMIFGDRATTPTQEILGAQTEKVTKSNVNTIVINPNRSKEKDQNRLELANGIAGEYIFLFDNENHNYIEGETVPDHNIVLTLGGFNSLKKSNPDGFFSFDLPKDMNQFQKGSIELKNENFQIVKSYSFIFVQKNYFNRKFFLSPKTNTVYSIADIPGYKSSTLDFYGIDNSICGLTAQTGNNVNNLQAPEKNIIVLPKPLTVEDISTKKYAIFEIKNINPAVDIETCEKEFETLDLKIEWHNDTLTEINKEEALSPSLPVSDPAN